MDDKDLIKTSTFVSEIQFRHLASPDSWTKEDIQRAINILPKLMEENSNLKSKLRLHDTSSSGTIPRYERSIESRWVTSYKRTDRKDSER